MTRRATIRPAALDDVGNAFAWYENQRPGLGDEFLAAIADGIARLESNPEEFPLYHRDFRRVLVDRFPYKIFFRFNGASIIVFRVLHAASKHRKRLSDT